MQPNMWVWLCGMDILPGDGMLFLHRFCFFILTLPPDLEKKSRIEDVF